jgi:hypothetical protein
MTGNLTYEAVLLSSLLSWQRELLEMYFLLHDMYNHTREDVQTGKLMYKVFTFVSNFSWLFNLHHTGRH